MKIMMYLLAMEWGFKACEKGWNLEKATDEFVKLLRGKGKDWHHEN